MTNQKSPNEHPQQKPMEISWLSLYPPDSDNTCPAKFTAEV
ncbi:MAG: hypothetical protein JWN30_603 [Bacilli bacterium]|nr:hypothetical protein [Bacilli bacterium]